MSVQKVSRDNLWLSAKICLHLFQYKPIKIILKILSLSIIILTSIQTFLYLKRFDSPYFMKYLPVYAGSLFILASIFCIENVSPAILSAVEEFEFWDDANFKTEIRNWIKWEALYINTFMVVDAFVAYLSGIFHVIPLDEDNEIFYPLPIFQEFFPDWTNVLEWLYRASFLIVPLVMIAPLLMIIYFTSRLRFQLFLLLDILENISEGYDISKANDLIDNSTYQKEIKERLKTCIKRHHEFLSTGSQLMKNGQLFILIMSAAGVILGVSIIFFLFSFEGSFEKRYPRLVTLVISTGLTFTHVIIAGQLVENTAMKLYEILQFIDWHGWNQENQKILLIFMHNTQQELQIKFLDEVAVNYQLGISIGKAVYSLISVLSSFKNLEET